MDDKLIPTPYFPPPPTYTQPKANPPSQVQDNNSHLQPTAIRRSRKLLLPPLLLLAFATTILSAIYTYCIASPHTRLSAADYVNNPDAERNDSIFRRDDANIPSSSSSSSPTAYTHPTIDLVSYTLGPPIITMLFIVFEFALQIFRPKLNYSRPANYLFVTSVLITALGWLTTTLLWTYCEISPFQHTIGAQRVCPAAIRGHFMWGVHELSIAKTWLASLMVVGYLVHTFFAVKNLRGLNRWLKSNNGRDGQGLGLKHGDARMVLERDMEEGLKVQSSLRKAMKKSGQRVRIVG